MKRMIPTNLEKTSTLRRIPVFLTNLGIRESAMGYYQPEAMAPSVLGRPPAAKLAE